MKKMSKRKTVNYLTHKEIEEVLFTESSEEDVDQLEAEEMWQCVDYTLKPGYADNNSDSDGYELSPQRKKKESMIPVDWPPDTIPSQDLLPPLDEVPLLPDSLLRPMLSQLHLMLVTGREDIAMKGMEYPISWDMNTSLTRVYRRQTPVLPTMYWL